MHCFSNPNTLPVRDVPILLWQRAEKTCSVNRGRYDLKKKRCMGMKGYVSVWVGLCTGSALTGSFRRFGG